MAQGGGGGGAPTPAVVVPRQTVDAAALAAAAEGQRSACVRAHYTVGSATALLEPIPDSRVWAEPRDISRARDEKRTRAPLPPAGVVVMRVPDDAWAPLLLPGSTAWSWNDVCADDAFRRKAPPKRTPSRGRSSTGDVDAWTPPSDAAIEAALAELFASHVPSQAPPAKSKRQR